METEGVSTKKPGFTQRAQEAEALIGRLLASGLSVDDISGATRVSVRTVYRWIKEGRAPHPIMLDSLRKLALKRGLDT